MSVSAHGVFGTAIICMDGRVQRPVSDWMRRTLRLDYVDIITEPGPDGLLAKGDARALDSIRRRVEISVEKHGSRVIAVCGHADCAGHPVSEAHHRDDVRRSLDLIASWDAPVDRLIGLWVGEDWNVALVEDRMTRRERKAA